MSGISRKLSMLTPQAGGALVPAGTVVGFAGTLAEAGALSDWTVCDGTSGTYDLTGQYIIGAGSTYALGDTGSGGGSTTSSSAGSHTAGTTTDPVNSGTSWNVNTNVSGGSHSHTVTLDPPKPAARNTLFIQATAETSLPSQAVVWSTGTSADNFSVDDTIYNRMLVGVDDDSRVDSGSDNFFQSGTVTSSNGNHWHGNIGGTTVLGGSPGSGSGYATLTVAHTHGDSIAINGITPPYVEFVPMEATAETTAPVGIVLPYNGAIGSLPAGWSEYTALRDKFPRGAATAGGTGGSVSQNRSDTLTSNSWGHDHITPLAIATAGVTNYHAYKTASHSHTWSLTYSHLPNYTALYYITLS